MFSLLLQFSFRFFFSRFLFPIFVANINTYWFLQKKERKKNEIRNDIYMEVWSEYGHRTQTHKPLKKKQIVRIQFNITKSIAWHEIHSFSVLVLPFEYNFVVKIIFMWHFYVEYRIEAKLRHSTFVCQSQRTQNNNSLQRKYRILELIVRIQWIDVLAFVLYVLIS